MNPRNCPVCGSELPQTNAKGRPATYCGTVCRRAAEYAVRPKRRRPYRPRRGQLSSTYTQT